MSALARPAGSLAGPEAPGAPGWPLVLYFHRFLKTGSHYTNLPPSGFAHGLDLLGESFSPLDPLSVAGGMTAGGESPPSCLITIDDGWREGLLQAAPALERRGWRAIFFVSTGLVGAPERLSWAELRELRERGHVVASHGHHHRPFDRIGIVEARQEASRSLHLLEERVGGTPPLIAYPFGARPEPEVERAAFGDLLRFGTVKARPAPWSSESSPIRRTYLPADRQEAWPGLIRGWREAL